CSGTSRTSFPRTGVVVDACDDFIDVGSVTFNIFFFSSRRRHTRSKRDWSSDVCSSDLAWSVIARKSNTKSLKRRFARHVVGPQRSEERRVGKEGRTGGAAGDKEKKQRDGRNERAETAS